MFKVPARSVWTELYKKNLSLFVVVVVVHRWKFRLKKRGPECRTDFVTLVFIFGHCIMMTSNERSLFSSYETRKHTEKTEVMNNVFLFLVFLFVYLFFRKSSMERIIYFPPPVEFLLCYTNIRLSFI